MANYQSSLNSNNDDHHLLHFSTLPKLSLEQRRVLTLTTCLIIHLIDGCTMTSPNIEKHIRNAKKQNPKNVKQLSSLFKSDDNFFGGMKICDFLAMPEVSCLLHRVNVQMYVGGKVYLAFTSHYTMLKKKIFVHTLRTVIMACVNHGAKNGQSDELGNVKLIDVCNIWNTLKLFRDKGLRWKLHPTGKLDFLNGRELFNALVFFCSRELVITLPPTGSSIELAKLRLRNDINYLIDQMNAEALLAEKTMEICQHHRDVNPYNIAWRKVKSDIDAVTDWEHRTWQTSYADTWLNNIFGALHHSTYVKDYESLVAVIMKCSLSPIVKQLVSSTTNTELNQLVDMACYDSMNAVSYWDLQRKTKFFQIFNKLALKLNKVDRDYLLNYMELLPNHKNQLNIVLFAQKKIVMEILMATCSPSFINETQIAEYIKIHHHYDVCLLLKKMGFPSISTFIARKRSTFEMLDAMLTQHKDGMTLYRNFYSIWNDPNLCECFPFQTIDRLFLSLEKAVLKGKHQEGFVRERDLFKIYFRRYRILANHPWSLGAGCSSLVDFLNVYKIDTIIQKKVENGDMLYRICDTFEKANEILIKQKKLRFRAIRLWLGKLKLAKDLAYDQPSSTHTIMKKHFNRYKAHVCMSQNLCLAEPFKDEPSRRRRLNQRSVITIKTKKKQEKEKVAPKIYSDDDGW